MKPHALWGDKDFNAMVIYVRKRGGEVFEINPRHTEMMMFWHGVWYDIAPIYTNVASMKIGEMMERLGK